MEELAGLEIGRSVRGDLPKCSAVRTVLPIYRALQHRHLYWYTILEMRKGGRGSLCRNIEFIVFPLVNINL